MTPYSIRKQNCCNKVPNTEAEYGIFFFYKVRLSLLRAKTYTKFNKQFVKINQSLLVGRDKDVASQSSSQCFSRGFITPSGRPHYLAGKGQHLPQDIQRAQMCLLAWETVGHSRHFPVMWPLLECYEPYKSDWAVCLQRIDFSAWQMRHLI